MPLWQRISQTLKVEVGFGSSVWSSFFHLKKGPSKGNFSTWHAAFPSVPALQTRKQPMTTEGRKTRKACKTACIPFHSVLSCSSGLGLSSVYYHFISFAYFLFSAREKLLFSTESSLEVGYLIRESLCVLTKSQIFSSALYSTGWFFSPTHPAATQKSPSQSGVVKRTREGTSNRRSEIAKLFRNLFWLSSPCRLNISRHTAKAAVLLAKNLSDFTS